MTRTKYAKIHDIYTEQNWAEHFRYNLLIGKMPVAMYSCQCCDEIVSGDKLMYHKCEEEKINC